MDYLIGGFMKFISVLILAFTFNFTSQALADDVSVTINGEQYSCSKGSGVACGCEHDGNYTVLKVNGTVVFSEFGTQGEDMVTCLDYQKNTATYCN